MDDVPLPEPINVVAGVRVYTVAQMRAYGAARAAAERVRVIELICSAKEKCEAKPWSSHHAAAADSLHAIQIAIAAKGRQG